MKKLSLLLLALALLAGLLLFLLATRSDAPDAPSDAQTAGEPTFTVLVEKPRSARPLFGILPRPLEDRLAEHGELAFDHDSPGAAAAVAPGRIELGADGWLLVVEAAGEAISPATRLVFSLRLAEQQQELSCRPGDPPAGRLTISSRDADRLDGRFVVELATCENLETGKIINWPPAPLTVRGSFAGLESRARQSR